VIAGAIRRLPEAVDTWSATVEPWRPVVVYCVRGHEVSQDACAALRTRGLDARYVAGGLESWRVEGNALQPFAAPTRMRCITPSGMMASGSPFSTENRRTRPT